jgi:Domain of unknown function (DUF4115)
MNGDGDTTTVKPPSSASSGSSADASGSSHGATPTTASSSSGATDTGSPSASPSQTKRPVTLDLRLSGDSFVTVRAPGGHVFLSKLLHKGDHRTFDSKKLVVVLGNAGAVEVRMNGRLLPRGRQGQVARLVAQRK